MVIVPLRVRPFAKNVSTLRVLPSAPNDQNPVGAALVAARRGAGDAVTADGLSRWIAVLTTTRPR